MLLQLNSDAILLFNPVIYYTDQVSIILQIAVIGNYRMSTLPEISFLPGLQQLVHTPSGLEIGLAEDGNDVLPAR